MSKASVFTVLVAYAAFFAFAGMPTVEAAPTETPDTISLGNADSAAAIKSVWDSTENFIKSLSQTLDISRLLREITKVVSSATKTSQSKEP